MRWGRIICPSVRVNRFNGPQNQCGEGQERRHQKHFLETPMLSIFRRLMKNEHGATAIEYTLIASLIAVAAIVAMKAVGSGLLNTLNNVAGNLA
jgi:pilus assembly protein Flp/PilA